MKKAKKAKAKRTPVKQCAVFALCTNAATGTIPNVILGPVDACDRCQKWYAKMSS